MTPYFETVKSYVDVPVTDTGVESRSFFEATDGLVQMFDLFGSGVFGFIQADLKSNINGVRTRYEAQPDRCGTLEDLVRSASSDPNQTAIPCLVRLMRGLSLTCKALQHMQQDRGAELHVCFRRAYDDVLKQHHSWVIRSIVYVAIRAVPYRDDFYSKIAQGGSREKLDDALNKWLVGLDRIVQHMITFLHQGNYGRV
ncbi:glycolipid transfer protein domain-containing protein [Crepidotus variabilis]|uniref:Glycolipid transfer protein domain-containing protein n=1 Tax=Crepidotus variabilis TaxID=179855 RepID=A0A9P6JIK1_9AGAR|nr:glycolipid transfer protein domain-containing protein [Crepidotus variabilis]